MIKKSKYTDQGSIVTHKHTHTQTHTYKQKCVTRQIYERCDKVKLKRISMGGLVHIGSIQKLEMISLLC